MKRVRFRAFVCCTTGIPNAYSVTQDFSIPKQTNRRAGCFCILADRFRRIFMPVKLLRKLIIFAVLFSLSYVFPVAAMYSGDANIIDEANMTAEDADYSESGLVEAAEDEDTVPSFEDSIQIDGRTYKVSPNFTIPVGIDVNSPVKINFDEETREVVSIEKLIDDTANNSYLEYHFGIVNAISKANTDLQYRVYVNGIGYLFDNNTKIDEENGFLDKYASIAVITYKGRAVMCKVYAANTAIEEDKIFWGEVENAVQSGDSIVVTVAGKEHILNADTEVLGAATVVGTWVFGYEIGAGTKFISVITDSFPSPDLVTAVEGFITFVGNAKENGIYYISIGDDTYRVMPDSAVNDQFQIGEYVVGYELNGDILTVNRVDLPYDKGRYKILYEPISDVFTVTDYTVPGYKRVVSIVLDDEEIGIDTILNTVGELNKDVPVMAIFRDGIPQIVVAVESLEQDRVPVYGYVESVSGEAPNFEIIIGGKKYTTNYDTVIASVSEIVPGTQIAAIANRAGMMDLIASFESVLPDAERYLYAGKISKIAVNAFQIDDRIIDYDGGTKIVGSFKEGKFAAVAKIGDYAEMIYIVPDDYSDYTYGSYSGVLNGLRGNSARGRKSIRLDDRVFYITSETRVVKNPVYDEIGTALYKGLGEISVIDILLKPDDLGTAFKGKISESVTDKYKSSATFSIGSSTYNVKDVTALIDFTDVRRLYPGATVEGYAYGNDVLAVKLVRGAGLFGLLFPPWMEYVLVGALLLLILLLIISKAAKNRTEWKTGSIETGANDTIILREENGKINSYETDLNLYEFLTGMKEQLVTVQVQKGRIIDVK